MLIPILVSILLILLVFLLFMARRPRQSVLYFTGPHSTGKTAAILCLLGIPNKTVTTLSDHRIFFKNKEIIEIVPDDNTNEFIKKFRLNKQDKFVFFVKNEQEFESFPDLSIFNISFVLWEKTEERNNKRLFYLNESREKLENLVKTL